jgi:hypothetical protein
MYKKVREDEIEDIKREVKITLRNKIIEDIRKEFADKTENKLNNKIIEYYQSAAKLMSEISIMNIVGIQPCENFSHLDAISKDFKQIGKMYNELLMKLKEEEKRKKEKKKSEKKNERDKQKIL